MVRPLRNWPEYAAKLWEQLQEKVQPVACQSYSSWLRFRSVGAVAVFFPCSSGDATLWSGMSVG